MTPPFQDVPSYRGLLGIAPDQLDRFTATKSVQFLVGHDRAEFSIHPNLLSSLSAPLIALVNGETEESLQCCVTCEDVDKAVFSRFVQFVYTGAYTGFASAEKDGPARYSEVIEITANVDGQLPDTSSKDVPFSLSSANTTTRQGNVKDSSDSTALFGALRGEDKNGLFKLPYSLASYHRAATEGPRSLFGGPALSVLCKQHQPGSRRSSKRIFATTACDCGPYQMKRDFVSAFVEKYGGDDGQIIRQTKPTSEAMSFVFLGHARVWVFAHRFAIASLMDLAFSQLAHELTQWTIWPSAFVPAFGGLVCYVYGNRSAGDCQLRHLVAQFAACVAKDVSGLEGWSALLKEVPDFAADLVEQMTNRLA